MFNVLLTFKTRSLKRAEIEIYWLIGMIYLVELMCLILTLNMNIFLSNNVAKKCTEYFVTEQQTEQSNEC